MQGQCPKCKGIFGMQQEWVGRLIQCPHCGEQFIVQWPQSPIPMAQNVQDNGQPANSPRAKDEDISSVGAFGCYLKVLRHYADFTGRASRKEYWFFVLFNLIIAYCIGYISGVLGLGNLLGHIYSLVVLLPGIALAVRRLHDINCSGWLFLIILIPLIGALLLILDFVKKGTDGPNKYGNDPYGAVQPQPTVPPMS